MLILGLADSMCAGSHQNGVSMSTPPGTHVRLFLALWPPPAVHAALLAHAETWSWPAGARRTRPERQHITLHFLGNVDTVMLPRLRRELALPWEGCELVLDRTEVWPGGIAVLEAGEVPMPLQQLHAQLAERLLALDLPVERRRFRPHATLGRKATGALPPPLFTPLRWPAAPAYALVQSLPGGRGYETLQSFG
jgi:2'-5' RNA ligase